jgi:hypothetical protein
MFFFICGSFSFYNWSVTNNIKNVDEMTNAISPPANSFGVLAIDVAHKDNTEHIAIKKKIKFFMIYLRYLV